MLGSVGCRSTAPRDQLQILCQCLGQEHWQESWSQVHLNPWLRAQPLYMEHLLYQLSHQVIYWCWWTMIKMKCRCPISLGKLEDTSSQTHTHTYEGQGDTAGNAEKNTRTCAGPWLEPWQKEVHSHESCHFFFQGQFQKLGGILKDNEKVTGIKPGPVVTVTTSAGVYHAKSLVITAGTWNNTLLAHTGLQLPLEVFKF